MARTKRTVTQRSFMLGECREDLLEGDDLEIRQNSCWKASNVRVAATRIMVARPGFRYVRTLGAAHDLIELRPSTGEVFGLIVNDTSLQIILPTGTISTTLSSVPWTDASTVWVEPYSDETVIGGPFGLYVLSVSNNVWSLAPFTFDDAPSGQLAQPYWAYTDNVSIQPSATDGEITVTASSPVWTPGYVGLRIRYSSREIEVTEYVSPTVLRGNVVSVLYNSYAITVDASTSFRVGDAVKGQDTDFAGVVISIDGYVLNIVTTAFLDGPDIGEELSSPIGSATITAKATIAPLMSPVWDEPLMSAVRGFPRAGASAGGRLTLIDFPEVNDVICMSSSRSFKDFRTGAEDDDAITRQVGDNAPRFLHAVNAGDLLLFSNKGLYYIDIRGGGILTPTNFNPIRFDMRAANNVRPVAVEDGVVFVEASGKAIAACLLDGNIYLKWSVKTISTYHSHQIHNPTKLCGPSLFSEATEKYLFVVNSDGTMSAVSWFSQFQSDSVGFIPWNTLGNYRSMSPLFGGYWAIVDRVFDGVSHRLLERMDAATLLDCAADVSSEECLEVGSECLEVNGERLVISTPNQLIFGNETVYVASSTWNLGEHDVAADGVIENSSLFPSGSYAGLNFRSVVRPWPIEIIESPRAGMLKARLVAGSVSVYATSEIAIRANNNTSRKGGYAFGDVLEDPPPPETKVHKFLVIGQRDHHEIEIIKEFPGEFQIMAITQEVQA